MEALSPQPGSDNCEICAEISTGQIHGQAGAQAPIADRLVARSDTFVAFPSVSPLRMGHILIVPDRHVTASAHLDPARRLELVDFAGRMAGAISPDGEVACFEHGVARGQPGGCGIDHAHLHLMPMEAAEGERCLRSIEAEFPLGDPTSLADALAAPPGDVSYLFFGSLDSVRLSMASHIPSQFLRRCVARSIGNPVEDWRSLADWEVLQATHAELVR